MRSEIAPFDKIGWKKKYDFFSVSEESVSFGTKFHSDDGKKSSFRTCFGLNWSSSHQSLL